MTAAPFTPVDGLILSWLASMPLKSPTPATLGEEAARPHRIHRKLTRD